MSVLGVLVCICVRVCVVCVCVCALTDSFTWASGGLTGRACTLHHEIKLFTSHKSNAISNSGV